MFDRTQHQVSEREEARGCLSMIDVLYKRRESLKQNDRGQIPTGRPDLDETLSGGMPTVSLVIVGARPSVGKTSAALGMWEVVALRSKAQRLRRSSRTDLRRLFVASARSSSTLCRLLASVGDLSYGLLSLTIRHVTELLVSATRLAGHVGRHRKDCGNESLARKTVAVGGEVGWIGSQLCSVFAACDEGRAVFVRLA